MDQQQDQLQDFSLKYMKQKPINLKDFPTNIDHAKLFNELNNLTLTNSHDENMVDQTIDENANRYCDIIPYKHTLVQVSGNTEKEKYINANYIYPNFPNKSNNYFLSTQGPLETTFNNFWKMVWEHESKAIIMLCKLKEANRPKCDQYWPNLNKQQQYGQITVENIKESKQNQEITKREFKVKKQNEQKELTVEQIHFEGWPDHGVPDNLQILEQLTEITVGYYQNQCKPIVHCSAGVGRTGSLLSCTISYLQLQNIYQNIQENQQIAKELKKQEYLNQQINMFDIIRKLREQRVLMVQTKEQLKMVYKITYDFIHKFAKKL